MIAATATSSANVEEAPVLCAATRPGTKTRLPEVEVSLIPSWVMNPAIRPQDDVEVKTARRRKFLAFQDWIRGEVEKKGFAELPDEFLADRDQVREWMEEELDQMLERIDFSDQSGFGNCAVDDDGQEDLKRTRKMP
nr:unnamed protein product [Digitaria exilis]